MSLEETQRTERRNVVLVHLESTRARSVTPYNEEIETTPFLDELAQKSLLVEQAYTTVPRTSKAIIAVNYGIQPHLPEEVFGETEDPFEEHNIVDERDEEEIEERRNDVVAWRARVNAIYEGKIVAG